VLSLRARLAVVGYVAITWPIMTAFLFGPLALLIAGSRPQGRRAWIWLVALTLWLAFWAAQPGSLLEELVRAAAVLSAGIGVLILLLTQGSVSARALRATGGVVLGTASLAAVVGIRWRDVELAVVQQGAAAQRLAVELLNRGNKAPNPETVAALQSLGEGMRPMAPFFPGVVALLLFAGLCLAAMLAPRITGRAVMPVPGRFEEFRFSDHLVWSVILGLVGLLFLGATPAAGPAASLLTFGVGLYALRGSAVLATALQSASLVFVVLLMVGALFLLPFAVGGLALLGLADIWLDFRRRMAPPPSGG
jgi:hypothetical protein